MEDSKNCSAKKCCWMKCIISVVAVFVFTMAYDWLVMGKLLYPMFAQTPSLWRQPSEMQAILPWCIGFHLAMAAVLTCMFKGYKNYSAEACSADPELAKKCRPCCRGMCFGLHIGLIFGLGMFATYLMSPISLTLAGGLFAAGLVKGIGIGLVLALTCGKKKEA